MDKKVYLDSASTTYINSEVLAEMMPILTTQTGTLNGVNSFSRQSYELVARAKRIVAKAIGSKSSEIYFTSNSAEANNLAILGIARANKDRGNHIIVSKIEDLSILNACKQLEKEGFKVTYIPVDEKGVISLSALMHEIKKDTILVSANIANGDVGTIQSLNAIARTVKEKDIIFHCDATYAFGNININVKDLNIDAMTISSNQIYGPTQGALYVKNSVDFESIILGEQFNKRAGECCVANIVGFAKAVDLASQNITLNAQKVRSVRDYFTKKVMEQIDNVHFIGSAHQRVSNIVALSFEFVNAEPLAYMLDREGIAVKPYSATLNDDLLPNSTLLAMKIHPQLINTIVRFSFAKNTTKEDADYVVEKLVEIVKKLREMSPLHISVVQKENK